MWMWTLAFLGGILVGLGVSSADIRWSRHQLRAAHRAGCRKHEQLMEVAGELERRTAWTMDRIGLWLRRRPDPAISPVDYERWRRGADPEDYP